MTYVVWLLLGLTLWLTGCKQDVSAPFPGPTAVGGEETVSLAALNRGARLFQEHCAQCHGPEGQGHPDWQTPGVVAAPPVNGTGNDWKRSQAELVAIIKEGANRGGVQIMPGWKERMTDAEVADVIAWFQALWPQEVYAKWRTKAATGPRG